MTRQRKKTKPVKEPRPISSLPKGRQAVLHHTLSLALLRALTMNLHAGTATEEAESSGDDDASAALLRENVENVGLHPGLRAHSATSLWFATLYSAVDYWRRYGFENHDVDRLLLDNPHVETMRDFRNAVFHPTPANDPVFSQWSDSLEEVETWARELYGSMSSYTRDWFSTNRPQPG